jgi:hypothetical protein
MSLADRRWQASQTAAKFADLDVEPFVDASLGGRPRVSPADICSLKR